MAEPPGSPTCRTTVSARPGRSLHRPDRTTRAAPARCAAQPGAWARIAYGSAGPRVEVSSPLARVAHRPRTLPGDGVPWDRARVWWTGGRGQRPAHDCARGRDGGFRGRPDHRRAARRAIPSATHRDHLLAPRRTVRSGADGPSEVVRPKMDCAQLGRIGCRARPLSSTMLRRGSPEAVAGRRIDWFRRHDPSVVTTIITSHSVSMRQLADGPAIPGAPSGRAPGTSAVDRTPSARARPRTAGAPVPPAGGRPSGAGARVPKRDQPNRDGALPPAPSTQHRCGPDAVC